MNLRVPLYLLLLSPFSCWAAVCTPGSGAANLVVPNITLQRDLPVGSEITPELVSPSMGTVTCVNSAPQLTYQEFGIKGYGSFVTFIRGRKIYDSGVPGIGYAVGGTMNSSCDNYTNYVQDANTDNFLLCAINGMFGIQPMVGQARVTFYKTAAITGTGYVSPRQVGAFILRNNQQTWVWPEIPISTSGFTIMAGTCSVTTPQITVNMGTVEKRAFRGPGTSPGDSTSRTLNIPLSCNPDTQVNLQLDGNVADSNNGVLAISSQDGAAKGVGIQLLYQNQPVKYATPMTIGKTSSSGLFNISLLARYYQTQPTIATGSANANVTFSLTYR